jgi:hypothetical protein
MRTVVTAAFLLASCARKPDTMVEKRKPIVIAPPEAAAPPPSAPVSVPLPIFATHSATVKVVQIARHSYASSDRPGSLSFHVSLGRPDLGIEEPSNRDGSKLSADLAAAVRPRLMYLSARSDVDPESGSMCDRPRFPHECEIYNLSDRAAASDLEMLLKIRFEDDSYAAVPIVVPLPAKLPLPEIVAPKTTPQQGAQLLFAFRDVGAGAYKVTVRLCEHYGGRGINPCLEHRTFEIHRHEGQLALAPGDKDRDAHVTLDDGVVTLTAPTKLVFEESVHYQIEARTDSTVRGLPARSFAHVEEVLRR